MNCEGVDQGVNLLLHLLNHLGPALRTGQMLHEAALEGKPDGSRAVEEQGLPDQAEGNPLVEGVEHLEEGVEHLREGEEDNFVEFSPLLQHRPFEIYGRSFPGESMNVTANLKEN